MKHPVITNDPNLYAEEQLKDRYKDSRFCPICGKALKNKFIETVMDDRGCASVKKCRIYCKPFLRRYHVLVEEHGCNFQNATEFALKTLEKLIDEYKKKQAEVFRELDS